MTNEEFMNLFNDKCDSIIDYLESIKGDMRESEEMMTLAYQDFLDDLEQEEAEKDLSNHG